MSADNWTTCPSCEHDAEEARKARVRKARDAYGKVSEAEYLDLVRKAEKPVELEETLREDFSIGIQGGAFGVSYRASCEHCGFEFRFEHDTADVAKEHVAEAAKGKKR